MAHADPHVKALNDVLKGTSIREAALTHGISRDSVRRRFLGLKFKAKAQEHRQRLSPTLESKLAEWVLTQARLGWAPPHNRFRLFAQALVKASGGDEIPLGKHWHLRFFKRWPEVKTMASTKMDFLRLNGASRDNLVEFFQRLELDLVANVSPANTWNMDEIGAQIGLGDSPLVVGPAALNEVFTMDTPRGEWTTSIEANSAADYLQGQIDSATVVPRPGRRCL